MKANDLEYAALLRGRNLKVMQTGLAVLCAVMPLFAVMDYLTLAEKWGPDVRDLYVIADVTLFSLYVVLFAVYRFFPGLTKRLSLFMALLMGNSLVASQVFLLYNTPGGPPYILLLEILIPAVLIHMRPAGSLFYLSACTLQASLLVLSGRYAFVDIMPPVLAVFVSGVVMVFLRDRLAQNSLEIRKKNSELAIRTRDLEIARSKAQEERQKSENILLNILPQQIASELKQYGVVQPRTFDSATIMFTDFRDFTKVAAAMPPRRLIDELDVIFLQFDHICERNNLEKLKTIGDSYMCAGGLPETNSTHAIDVCMAALEIQFYMKDMKAIKKDVMGTDFWDMRLGIHTGPVIAGVIGKNKFAYDVWGDAVNVASRMESSDVEGRINISEHTYELVKDFLDCEYRGEIEVKNKGSLRMYFLNQITPALSKGGKGQLPNEEFHERYKEIENRMTA